MTVCLRDCPFLWTDPTGAAQLLARWKERLAGPPEAVKSDSTPAHIDASLTTDLRILRKQIYSYMFTS